MLSDEALRELREKAVKRGEFTLSSGKKSSYYINIKEVYTRPGFLREIVREMGRLFKKEEVDKVGGVALGAVPIATALSLEVDIPFLLLRKERKGHGTDFQIEGVLRRGDRVLMVEDVTTSGGTLLGAVRKLRAEGADCRLALTVVDRGEGAVSALKERGVELRPLLSAADLLESER
jgi:orotate phosphoribosyltransferase